MCVCNPLVKSPWCGIGECQWPDQARNPTTTPYLSTTEIARLQRVFAEWPEADWTRGLVEEIEDVMAARELAKMKPLTVSELTYLNSNLRGVRDVRG